MSTRLDQIREQVAVGPEPLPASLARDVGAGLEEVGRMFEDKAEAFKAAAGG